VANNRINTGSATPTPSMDLMSGIKTKINKFKNQQGHLKSKLKLT